MKEAVCHLTASIHQLTKLSLSVPWNLTYEEPQSLVALSKRIPSHLLSIFHSCAHFALSIRYSFVMARQLVAILAAAVAFSGVSAGPCKPVSSLALSSAIPLETTTTATSHETASSTVTVDVIETTGAFDTTVTDATTDATGTKDAVDTTITESATNAATAGSITTFLTTTTTEQSPEQSATTTAGPVGPGPCLEEQVFYNPSFDDSISS